MTSTLRSVLTSLTSGNEVESAAAAVEPSAEGPVLLIGKGLPPVKGTVLFVPPADDVGADQPGQFYRVDAASRSEHGPTRVEATEVTRDQAHVLYLRYGNEAMIGVGDSVTTQEMMRRFEDSSAAFSAATARDMARMPPGPDRERYEGHARSFFHSRNNAREMNGLPPLAAETGPGFTVSAEAANPMVQPDRAPPRSGLVR